MMKKFYISLMALLGCVAAFAQATIRVDVHSIVELSERFNVVFVVEGEHSPSDFQWEPGEDFTLVWGPQKGSSTSISMVNGKTTRSSQTSYTYILQARRAGTFTLPPATARVKGNEIHSRSVEIQVVPGDASKPSSGTSQGSGTAPSQGSSTAPSSGADLFLRLVLSRNKVVVGEPVTATLKIYNRANLSGFENAKFPSFNGFWSAEVEAPQNINFQREQLGGQIYNAAVLRRFVDGGEMHGDVRMRVEAVDDVVPLRIAGRLLGKVGSASSAEHEDVDIVRLAFFELFGAAHDRIRARRRDGSRIAAREHAREFEIVVFGDGCLDSTSEVSVAKYSDSRNSHGASVRNLLRIQLSRVILL